ncbi:MAG: hypothetical protein GY917_18870, partial [Planctomycetaceae bacterium]|nr:hypothetical protein [Planctomycetaceae bacterium]
KLMVTETSQFGSSVAISGDTVIAGAPGTNSVYVFRNLDGTWTDVATLRPAAPQDGAEFGYSMAISDNTLVVGAPGYRANGDPVGAAYVFQRVNGLWTETARLTGSDATSDDELGQFVAISNDRILVGGNQEPYLFENHTGNWQEITQLPNLARDPQSGFGERFAISNDAIVVGARLDGPQEGSSSYHGSAYIIGSVSAFHTVSVTAGSDTQHDFG